MGEIVSLIAGAIDRGVKLPIFEESFDEKKIGLTQEQMKSLRAEIERYKATRDADRLANFFVLNKTHKFVESNSEMDKLENQFEITEE